MSKNRLEAFSDGVIAIIITIMVLELKVPHSPELASHFTPVPVALYGGVLLGAGCAYSILVGALLAQQGKDSVLARALGRDLKGKISLAFYVVAIPLAFVQSWVACALYVVVAVMWLIPDQRIERKLVA